MAHVRRHILGPDGQPYRAPLQPRARYDAAQTTDENKRHWAAADSLSARGANSPSVRRTLRERARYEVHEANSYARGITLTLANDLVGTGPRLQVQTDDSPLNRQVERAFRLWAAAIGLAEKLRTMKLAKTVDGEAIAMLATNAALATSVRLDLRLIECDLVTTPFLNPLATNAVDGILFDDAGNAVEYHVLKQHPGDAGYRPFDFDRLPARSVLHWFRCDRPGQCRGVPEITTALPIFAQLRRYRAATLSAAEIAASFAAVLETDHDPDAEDAPEPFDSLEIDRGLMTTLPSGAKMHQFQAQHPTNTYDIFERRLLTEAARCLGMTSNTASGDSSTYNYASGRLDYLVYRKSIDVERSHCARVVLDRLFAAWLDEAVKVPGLLPPGLSALAENLPHSWYWDGWEHVDPVKNESAAEIALRNHTTTLAEIYSAAGLDWEDALLQRAREVELLRRLGLTPSQALPTPAPPAPAADPDEEEEAHA